MSGAKNGAKDGATSGASSATAHAEIPALGALARTAIVFRREFRSYFQTPLAAVFLVIFLFLAGLFAFNIGGFYERNQSDLRPFFQFHPWLYVFLVPAVSMRLWAEERRTGTIELLMTLPFGAADLVVGKFLAAWAFTTVALSLTFPMWITVSWLGTPDHGTILVAYLASALLGGAFLAIGAFLSALTKNQVIAFVLCAVACFVLLLAGFPAVIDFLRGWAPRGVVEGLASTSALTHYESMMRGVVDLRDVLYFGLVIAAFLVLNVFAIDWKKSD
jgi:ABC-2 type transport system permease protein